MSLVLTAAQMRAVDGSAQMLGLPSLLLMENAGRGMADAILRDPRFKPGAEVRIVTGGGNNGGDGFVIARHLALAGARVTVLALVAEKDLKGDALTALRALRLSGLAPVRELPEDPALERADVVVDAVFGTGLSRDVTGLARDAIQAMNAAGGWKVAVDVPSGLDSDTGQVRGVVFRADTTLTIGARKVGLVLDAALPVGELVVVPLGIPVVPAAALGPFVHWQGEPPTHESLPRQSPVAHKGRAGHLLLIASSPGKTGAGLLAARAAFRAGAGLVTVASTRAGQTALDAKVQEAMTAAYSEGDDADGQSAACVRGWLAAGRYRAVALGPGIPTGAGMRALTQELVSTLPQPMVVDADGLNHLGQEAPRFLRDAAGPRVLTPHPGEAARLLRTDVPTLEGDRLGAARRLACDTGAIVVLKGPRTLIAEPDGTVFVNEAATAALATAGSGDVLTGLVGGFLAQGLSPSEAARVAVYWHGRAGISCERQHGVGVVAGDLPDAVAALMTTDALSRSRR